MNEVKLGQILTANPGRDAVHVAIVPMICEEYGGLNPGDQVAIGRGDEKKRVIKPYKGQEQDGYKTIGIVDPFLKSPVKYEQMFYVMLFPNTITSLRHVWSHPDFSDDATADPTDSERFMRNLAEMLEMTYTKLMTELHRVVEDGSSIYTNFETPDELYNESYRREIWKHFRNLTGIEFKDGEEVFFFRCAC